MKEKIALFCDVDVRSRHHRQRRRQRLRSARWCSPSRAWTKSRCVCWRSTPARAISTAGPTWCDRIKQPTREVSIGLVGKYVEYEDSYKSLKEALLHGGLAHDAKVNITWIEAERLKWPEASGELEDFDGILVPGGFGRRGIEGMLQAIRYARECKVPYFGICLGMQTMVIEFARNVCGLAQANSTEFDPATPDRVIYKLRELKGVDELGGTMRLGAYPCLLADNSFARQAYGAARDQRAPPPPLRIQSRVRRQF